MDQKLSISICADDFGITHKVNEAIIKLIINNRLTETSCIVLTKNFEKDAKKLKLIRDRIGVGLHLTLTDFKPLSKKFDLNINGRMPSNNSLFIKCLLRKINKKQICNEINLQIENFRSCFGFYPDFIDGHHHVHQFPLIRDCLIDVIKKKGLSKKLWVRNTEEKLKTIFLRNISCVKAIIISIFGKRFKDLAKKNLIRTNDGFSGVYNFSTKVNFVNLFSKFIQYSGHKHLIMVHPGHSDEILMSLDKVNYTRDIEFDFLLSDKFLKIVGKKKKLKKLF